MPLSRIIYASQAVSAFSPADFERLVNISALRNSRRNITGALVYSDGVFLQLLEGETSVIAERFAHISKDSRHRNVQLLADRQITARSFPSWDMSLLHEAEMLGNERTKFAKITQMLKTEPNAEQIGESAGQLLEEFKAAIERQSNLAAKRSAA